MASFEFKMYNPWSSIENGLIWFKKNRAWSGVVNYNYIWPQILIREIFPLKMIIFVTKKEKDYLAELQILISKLECFLWWLLMIKLWLKFQVSWFMIWFGKNCNDFHSFFWLYRISFFQYILQTSAKNENSTKANILYLTEANILY